jgi:hypothetical protein
VDSGLNGLIKGPLVECQRTQRVLSFWGLNAQLGPREGAQDIEREAEEGEEEGGWSKKRMRIWKGRKSKEEEDEEMEKNKKKRRRWSRKRRREKEKIE